MDIFVQKDSTCFPYRLKLNHHKIITGVKQVQNNITTLLLGIQDVEVTAVLEERRLLPLTANPFMIGFVLTVARPTLGSTITGSKCFGTHRCAESTCFCGLRRHGMIARIAGRALRHLFPLPPRASR